MSKSLVLVRVFFAVGILGLASGCATEAEPKHAASTVSADRMSSDVFHSDENSLIKYAQNKLRADCMERNGYPQENQAGIQEYSGTFDYLVPTAPAWAIATDEQARSRGFGKNSRPEGARVIDSDGAYNTASDQCRLAANEQLGPDTDDVVSQVHMFANTISGAVDDALYQSGGPDAQKLKSLYVPVMDCLDRRGLRWSGEGKRTLDAYGMFVKKGHHVGPEPEPLTDAQSGFTIIPAKPERQYVPDPAEAELAVTLAQCARESDFGDKYFELTLRVTREAIGKHEAELTELTPKVEAVAKRAATLVGR